MRIISERKAIDANTKSAFESDDILLVKTGRSVTRRHPRSAGVRLRNHSTRISLRYRVIRSIDTVLAQMASRLSVRNSYWRTPRQGRRQPALSLGIFNQEPSYSPPALGGAAADCGDPGPGGGAQGQAPRRPCPARHPHPSHLPRPLRRPDNNSKSCPNWRCCCA